MSLRMKIVIGVLLIPGLTAALLFVLIVAGVKTEVDRANAAHAANRKLLDGYHTDVSEQLDAAWRRVAQDWIANNLTSIPSGDMDGIYAKFRSATIFRSVTRITIDSAAKAPILDAASPQHPVYIKAPDGAAKGELPTVSAEELELLKAALDPVAGRTQARRNIVFLPFYIGNLEGYPPEFVFRLHLDVISPEPPRLEQPQPGLESLLHTAVWIIALGAGVLIAVMLLSIRRLVLRPLETLTEGSRRIAQGNFSSPLPEPDGDDEIARLTRAFNAMHERILEFQRDMESRVLSATQKIREQDRSLAVAQRLAATGTMAAGLAHEINNPLGGMMNAVRRIKTVATDAKQLEYLDLIDDGLRRIQELMKQILDFSRRRDAEPREFDMRQCLESAVDLVRHRFDDRHLLRVDLPPTLPPVFGDADAMAQVVVNLLLNARDALNSDGGEVVLGAHTQDLWLILTVRDNGEGMDDARRTRIFDPFFTTKAPGKGSGLGLAIVHTIVTNHSGTILVDSAPGKGTTFSVRLPVVK